MLNAVLRLFITCINSLCQFAQAAAVTKHHRLADLNSRHLFHTVQRLGSPTSGCSWLDSGERALPVAATSLRARTLSGCRGAEPIARNLPL